MRRLILFILMFLCRFLGSIPLGIVLFAGRFLGKIAYHLDKKHRSIAVNNLTLAFGRDKEKEDIDRIVLKVFENMFMNLMEFCRLQRLKKQDLDEYVTYSGLENIERAHKKGKGVIILTAHFGNWELLAASIAMLGYTSNVIVRKLDSPVMHEFVEWIRTEYGIKLIYKKHSMRKAIRALEMGEALGVLLDQNVTWSEGVFVDYFGRLACTNKGLALLATRSGAPVIPAFIIREKVCRHRIVFDKEIPLTVTGDKEQDVVVNTAKFTKVIEKIVRRYPEQWFWVHQRWKSRPEDDPRKGKKEG